jgi:hypothetical protein
MKWGALVVLATGFFASGAAAQSISPPKISDWSSGKSDPQDQNIRDPFVKTAPETWFLPEDYPALAPWGTEVDHELIELTIGVTGKPTACKATSFGEYILDVRGSAADSTARICPVVVKRGLFGPALDQNGKRVPALLRLRLMIQGRDRSDSLYLPLPSPPNPGWRGPMRKSPALLNLNEVKPVKAGPSGLPEIFIGVAADGKVMFCKIDKTSGSDLIDAAACKLIRAKARFEPGINADGELADATYWLRPES